jgi:hypothetical protein
MTVLVLFTTLILPGGSGGKARRAGPAAGPREVTR